MRTFVISVAALSLLLGLSAHAQSGHDKNNYRYGWRDPQGQQHYSDSLTREAIRDGYEVIDSQGMVVRQVPRALTPQEQVAAAASASKARSAARAHAEQQQADRQMLSAYPTEQSFVDAQQAELDNLDQSIHTTELNLKSQEENLAELLDHAAGIQSAGDTVSKALSERIAHQRAVVAEQRRTLEHQHQERQQAKQRAERQLRHYREVHARLQAQLQGG